MITSITPEYWSRFTLMEQLANIGTDISRAIRWRNDEKRQNGKTAFDLAIELLNLTINDPRHPAHRVNELKIVREALIDYFVGTNEYQSTDEAWENYFMFFNWIAAQERGR